MGLSKEQFASDFHDEFRDHERDIGRVVSIRPLQPLRVMVIWDDREEPMGCEYSYQPEHLRLA